MDEQQSRLLEHLLNIVDLITQELKDVKREINTSDKTIALIDQRLRAAEKIVNEIKSIQESDRFNNAKKDGSDMVRWAIIGFIGLTALGLIVTAAFNVLAKV